MVEEYGMNFIEEKRHEGFCDVEMKTFLILPHQLFAEEYLPEEEYEYILWEHPQYFPKYNYNKKYNR